MLERKTSEHRRPTASLRDTPVISSAARLNDVMRHSISTVNTPSEMLSRIASVGVRRRRFFFVLLLLITMPLRYSPSPGSEG